MRDELLCNVENGEVGRLTESSLVGSSGAMTLAKGITDLDDYM